jgi:hypothetical protein
MVILGEVLVVGGSALVVRSAIFWAWFAIKQKLLRGPDEALDKPPEAPMMKSLGMVLIGAAAIAFLVPACK